MSTMYQLTAEYMEILAMMMDGEVDAQVLEDTLEGLQGELSVKLDGYGCVIKELEGKASMIKSEEDRLYARRKVVENNITRLKERIKQMMEVTDNLKVDTGKFLFSIKKNPPKVEIFGDVPKKYLVKQAPTIDKKAIADVLKSGGKVKGAKLTQSTTMLMK